MAHSTAVEPATRLGRGPGPRARGLPRLSLRLRTRLQRPWLDGRLARGVGRLGDPVLALRSAPLVESREALRLARRLREVLTEGPPRGPSSAVPIDREAVRVAKPVLTDVITTLRSPQTIEARGVALAWRLLTEPGSPMYAAPGQPGDPKRLRQESILVLLGLRPRAGAAAGRTAGA